MDSGTDSLHCVLCNGKSLTRATKHASKAARFQPDDDGIFCSKCSRFACNACLKAITDCASQKKLSDGWCRAVEDHLKGKQAQTPFIGHCCEWAVESKEPNADKERRFEGYIFFPEYSLLIDPTFNGVDVHALGKDSKHNLEAVWHAVVDEEVSIQCEDLDVVPDRTKAKVVDLYSRMTEFNGTPTKIDIAIFGQVQQIGKNSRKGHHPTVEDIKHSFVVDDHLRSYFGQPAPFLLVIGLTKSSSKHCLLLRRYCSFDLQQSGKQLRMDIMSSCKMGKKGLEVVRRGGSSGCARVTETFQSYKKGGYLPRDEYGVKFIQQGTSWSALYIKPFASPRAVGSWNFGQPQVGGSFEMPKKLIQKHYVLQIFVYYKMYAPYILMDIDRSISPSAVEAQIQQNIEAGKHSSTLLDQVVNVSLMNKYSYVEHPVGFHVDVFKEKKPVLENKICFFDESITGSTGRGGAGKANFVWALLDW